MKKDQENGTSCKPRSVIRDLEILHRENRGTDLIDDAENHSSKHSRTIERSPRGLLECRLHIPKSGDAPGAHVIADGQTAETFGLMAELESQGAATSRLFHKFRGVFTSSNCAARVPIW